MNACIYQFCPTSLLVVAKETLRDVGFVTAVVDELKEEAERSGPSSILAVPKPSFSEAGSFTTPIFSVTVLSLVDWMDHPSNVHTVAKVGDPLWPEHNQ